MRLVALFFLAFLFVSCNKDKRYLSSYSMTVYINGDSSWTSSNVITTVDNGSVTISGSGQYSYQQVDITMTPYEGINQYLISNSISATNTGSAFFIGQSAAGSVASSPNSGYIKISKVTAAGLYGTFYFPSVLGEVNGSFFAPL